MNSVRQTLDSPRHIENTKTKTKSNPDADYPALSVMVSGR